MLSKGLWLELFCNSNASFEQQINYMWIFDWSRFTCFIEQIKSFLLQPRPKCDTSHLPLYMCSVSFSYIHNFK